MDNRRHASSRKGSAKRLSQRTGEASKANIMGLTIIGEPRKSWTIIPRSHKAHPEIPWGSMRGMRHRIAHGYFDINLNLVWKTVQTSLSSLLHPLSTLHAVAGDKTDG
jgi:uncharacterized protein with HEPN domain